MAKKIKTVFVCQKCGNESPKLRRGKDNSGERR